MIIDSHCHAGHADGLTDPWNTVAPLQDYARRAAQAGIHKTVIFAAFDGDYARANGEVAQIVAANPARYYGFAFVHAQRDKGRIARLIRRAVEEYGFVGIKVHFHDAPLNREICEAAREWRLPILYDVGGNVALAQILAEEYPDLDFIIPHLGSFADDWRAHVGLIDHLQRHPNIYTDTSGVRRFDLLKQAVQRAGAHKVLFGSDGPWLHPGLELHKIRLLGLPPEQEKLITGHNFLRLLAKSGRGELRAA
ncbi:amidohydrolase family protein [Massilia sp. W12]|uniref:amidohydrolase family protein n=1 Tax=Massilia sp. W12 TaxID=3126507 RepID=UPI0030CD4191